MATCIQVYGEDGLPSPLFASLLEQHGNEETALKEYAERLVRVEQDKYQLASKIANTQGFVDSFFNMSDVFTTADEASIRNNSDALLEEVFVKSEKKKKIRYYDAKGIVKFVELSEKGDAINDIIQSTKEMKNEAHKKLLSVFADHGKKSMSDTITDELGGHLVPVVMESLRGIEGSKVRDYTSFSNEPWYIPSLASEKILVYVNEDSKSVQTYTFIFPSFSYESTDFNDSRKDYVGKKYLGSNDLSGLHGINLTGTVANRKLLAGTILAASIKNSDPKAGVNSMRFVSLKGQGSFKHLDLYNGIKNLENMVSIDGISEFIPDDMKFIEGNPDVLVQENYNIDYVSLLFDEYSSDSTNDGNKNEFTEAYDTNDKKRMLAAVNRRIYQITKNNTKKVNGKPEYENLDSLLGKELLMLSYSKQMLMMKEGFDYRNKNTNRGMDGYTSFVAMQGEYANAELNLVFQEIQAVKDGLKQKYRLGHMKEMMAAVKEYINATGGAGVKQRVFNESQGYYKELFEQIEVRTLGEDGQLSAEKTKANILLLKDPDDLSNSMNDAQRKFARTVIRLHKESITALITKKIEDGTITRYENAEDWYEAEYKHSERLIPVGRKNSGDFLSDGQISKAIESSVDESFNVYNLNEEITSGKDLIFTKYGSATQQIGGQYGSPQRLKSLGLDFVNNELVMVNAKKNGSASMNVEQTINMNVITNLMGSKEVEFHSLFTASKMILLNQDLNEKSDRSTELKTLQVMFENVIYGDREKMKILKDKDVMKTVGALRKITSTGVLALNYKSAMLAGWGANISLLSDAMSNRYGVDFFNGKDYAKAAIWAGTHPAKFDKLIDLFMFHESDISNLMFSDKYQSGQKGIYKERYGMILHATADRLVKGMLIASQLIHDGIIDNFIEVDGQMQYDWTNDKRNPEEQKSIKENLQARGMDFLPYDEVMMRSLSTIAAKAVGAFSDNDRGRLMVHEGSATYFQFKSYLSARLTNLYMPGFENTNIRSYKVDKDGKLYIQSYYQEGIFNSFVFMIKEVGRLRSYKGAMDSMRPEQKANLRKLVYDVALFGASAALYEMMKKALDDDDLEDNKDLLTNLQYAQYDIVGIYNLGDYLLAMSTPVVVQYMGRILRAVWNLILLDFEKAGEQFGNLVSPVRTFDDLYESVKKLTE